MTQITLLSGVKQRRHWSDERKLALVEAANQGDRVSIMRLEKSRCVARRWPIGRRVIGKPVMMKAIAGIPLSSNEA